MGKWWKDKKGGNEENEKKGKMWKRGEMCKREKKGNGQILRGEGGGGGAGGGV